MENPERNTNSKRKHDTLLNSNDQDQFALSLSLGYSQNPRKKVTNSDAASSSNNTNFTSLISQQTLVPPLLFTSYNNGGSFASASGVPVPTPPPPPPLLQPRAAVSGRQPRARRPPTQAPRDSTKSDEVPLPFEWGTTKRAKVQTLESLLEKNITKISGSMVCKKCDKPCTLEFDLKEKFIQLGSYILENKDTLRDRAPSKWMNPPLPKCKFCNQENSMKPVISDKKKSINWLFLLLGQYLGCCTLDQLKYFCKHTKNHRTGAKDRVLFLTYLTLCKQLDPEGPFDR